MADYDIGSPGHHALPRELEEASEGDVEDVLRRGAAMLGYADVTVERVTSVLGGSCIVCTDVVAYVDGVPLLVARPRLY